MPAPEEFVSKGRLDALTDGVFAFAMTLLVVNIDLPEWGSGLRVSAMEGA